MNDEAARILAAWQDDAKIREQAGHYNGSQEALAYLVTMGGCMIMGRWVPVHFDWPDEEFAERFKAICREILQIAFDAGRQSA